MPAVKKPVKQTDPRVQRTRKLLQDALLELLAEKSFDAINVQDIANRSTLHRTTFYAHFVDKFDLFAAYTRDWFRQALRDALPEGAPFSRTNLQLVILATMQALAAMDDHCRPTEAMKPLVMSAVQEELAGYLFRWLEHTVHDRARREVGLKTTAAGLSWAIFGTAVDWSQMVERSPAESTSAQIATLLTEGLATVISEPDSSRARSRG
jgi:AcrR family transcriptional regulator